MPFPATNPALERALSAREYAEPTPVQLAVLVPEAAGRDMLVSAQTGSGKTVAFGLALSNVLLGDAERFERATDPLALIIAPTRELAIQVQRELTWLYAETGARIASCVGGMDPRAERDALRAGAHIVVGTPGRLRDHLERGRLVLSGLRAAVLDEADEMLDLGFRDDLQFILDATPAERQTLMFSATVPREIESLARSYQRDAMRIATAVRNQQHDDIEYRAVRTVPYAIEPTVVNLLRYYDAPAALVFCATREGVRRLHAGLANRGFSAVALSGELSQAERTEALEQLRSGRAKVLVATDVAARGLDLAELTLVIHADLPNDRETLLHRSGRTGRAGRKGVSILVVPPNKRRRAEELLGRSRINATWANTPTVKEIAAKDQERLMSMPVLDELATADDLELGRALLDGRTPEQVAAALVRMFRAALPVPETLKDQGRPAASDRPRSSATASHSPSPRPAATHDRARPERARPVRDNVEQSKPERAKPEPASPELMSPPNEPRRSKPDARRPHADAPLIEPGDADVHADTATASPHDVEPVALAQREPANEPAAIAAPARPPRRDPVDRPRPTPAEHRPYEPLDPAPRSSAERPRWQPDRDSRRDSAPPARSEGRGRKEHSPMVWFGLNIGRDKNADPRWLLPLICRVGDITKREIGSIKVGDTESRFEVRAEEADNFANAVRISKHKEGRIWRIGDDEPATSRLTPERSSASRPVERAPARAERPERQERQERQERPERPERPERRERPDRTERNVRPERAERPQRQEHQERHERSHERSHAKPASPSRSDASPRSAGKPYQAAKKFKPGGAKPYGASSATSRASRTGSAPGGSAPLKRSWKKDRRS